MFRFEGEKEFPGRPADLWAKLSDASFLAGCVPDVQTVARAGSDEAVFTVKPGFSFVRGTLEVTLRVLEAEKPARVRLSAKSRGIGSSSEVGASLTLRQAGEGSAVHWTAEVQQLGGLLKAVPQGLIRAAAQKVIGDVWAGVEKRLAG